MEVTSVVLGPDLDHRQHAGPVHLEHLRHSHGAAGRSEVRQPAYVLVGAANLVHAGVGVRHVGDQVVGEHAPHPLAVARRVRVEQLARDVARLGRPRHLPLSAAATLAQGRAYDPAVERFDAIVVGSGPAGSTTAYRLARAGARVCMVDKARFPRDKPCGGGLTGRALRLLPFSVEPVVEEATDTFELALGYRKSFERRSRGPLAVMTQRARLDAFLAEQAAGAGVEFRDGARVDAVTVTAARAEVRIAGKPVAADALIGADGANGITARSLDLAREIEHGVALEGNVPYGVASRQRYAGRIVLVFGAVPGGYAWVFPKGDHVNVGVGGWAAEGPRLRDHLRRLCAAHGLPYDRVESLRGHRLPMRRAWARLAHGRALLVGDAAGLVDPVSGDGMYEAFLSGKVGSAAVLELLDGRRESLDGYAEELGAGLARLVSASWGLKVVLDRFPRLSFGVMRVPAVWRVVEDVARGDLAYPGAASGAVRAPIGLLRTLARRAGDPGRPFRLA